MLTGPNTALADKSATLRFITKQLVAVCSFFVVVIHQITNMLPRTPATDMNPRKNMKTCRAVVVMFNAVPSMLQFDVILDNRES